jgi:O-methyltransferase
VERTEHISLQVRTEPVPVTIEDRYLDLIKRSVSRLLFAKRTERQTIIPGRRWLAVLARIVQKLLAPMRLELVRKIQTDASDYLESGTAARNRVEDAETMLGTRQLDQMQRCVDDVLKRGVQGDLLEAGVWRGGMTILMKAVLQARGDASRRVWVVDSFCGLPTPDDEIDSWWWKTGDMAASLDEVKENFARYGLLDDQVMFVEGFFEDSLPNTPISQLAVLRLDADLYRSTLDVLENLYPKLSAGGYAIFDDYQNLPECRRAIDEYRAANGIDEPIIEIDTRSVYWIKAAGRNG